MCSIVEDDFGDEGGVHAMTEEKIEVNITPDEICKKCNENKVIVRLNLKDGQCRDCFLHFVRHKFRAALGSTKIVKRDSNILLIFDGTPENVVMLDMIKYAIEQDTYKKLLFHPVILYLDEYFLFEKNFLAKQERLKKVIELLNHYKFPKYYCNLSSSSNEALLMENVTSTDLYANSETKFLASLEAVKSLTTRQDFLKQTKSNLYRCVAKHLNCSYIFVSEIVVNLSKTLLSNIALGRGSSAALDVAFCDDRIDGIKLLRPVRDLHKNEIESYINFLGLQHLPELSYGADQPEHLSIQNLTASFIDGLQKNFPSTVSTVYRTGDKISHSKHDPGDVNLNQQFANDLTLNDNTCRLCKTKLDYKDSTTLFAIEYSRLVSSNADTLDANETIEGRALDAVNGLNSGSADNAKRFLCHGCRNIFIDFNELLEIK